jgi:hypothetical protein
MQTGQGREAVILPSPQQSHHNVMKAICAPSSGKISDRVAYISSFGQCFRALVCPANHRTEAQQIMRQIFGNLSQAWGIKLTQQQRDVWNLEAPNQWTHPKLGQRGKLWGALFWESINAVRGRVGLPPAWTPPPRYIFPLTVVRDPHITNDQNGLRLFLRLAAPPT